MKIIPPAHRPWVPLPYQLRAVDFLASHYSAGLPLKPGGRKTSITLAAFELLRRAGTAKTMLVIAPLRVCRQVWRQEAAKWSDFRHLTFALLHGDNKGKALRSGADVYLINPEGVAWLAKQYFGRSLPFDVVVIDELTKFMNSQADRFKELRPRLSRVPFRWGLTGSLFAKGHLNIFGQQLILDDGAALGKFFTHFRSKYFRSDYSGFDYEPLPGAEVAITRALSPTWFYMDAADYSQLPPLVDVPRIAEMEPAQRKLYESMKKDMLIDTTEGQITAANAGACYSKLSQMANGAVYMEDRRVVRLHDLKLEMLDELMDELDGEPLLLAYEFNHDLERLREWYMARTKTELPYLGSGTSTRQETQWVAEWNARKLPLLAAHPQSAGHGLNMQEGQAYNVAWFSVSWDWELYDQFIRRVRRDGNTTTRIFNHLLIVRGTIDELKLAAVHDKDFTERRLVTTLNHEILREAQEAAGEKPMVAKLSKPPHGDAAPTPTTAQVVTHATPAGAAGGWGAPTTDTSQRERIQETIAPAPDRASAAAAAFSGGVQAAQGAVEHGDYGAAQQLGNSTGPAGPSGWGAQAGQQSAAEQQGEPAKPTRTRTPKLQKDANDDHMSLVLARAEIVAAIIRAAPDADEETIIDSARTLMVYVESGV